MFNLKDNILTTAMLIIVGVLILLSAGAGGLVANYLNQDTISNNVAVAVKAKEDLKDAVELNNKAQEEIIKLKIEIEDRAKTEKEIKTIEAENNKLTNEATENIKVIDNTKIVYIEKKEDIKKSKIIIDEIWNVYDKKRGDKNENIINSNK
jgi:hypothetical protein